MDRYRFFALPSMIIFSILLMIGCGGDGNDSDQDTSDPSVWSKRYRVGSGASVKNVYDGYIIVGTTEVHQKGTDLYLLRTDTAGNILWEKTYGGPGNDYGTSVSQLISLGGYIVGGEYAGSSSRQMWLMKTNTEGEALWQKFYGYNDRNEGVAEVKEVPLSGGFILIGTTRASANDSDVFLVRTDDNGNTSWYDRKGYSSAEEIGASIAWTEEDGGFVFTGMTDNFDITSHFYYADLWLVKVRADGSNLWQQHYGAQYVREEGSSIQRTSDGGYIAAGIEGPLSDKYIFLVKTDSGGIMQWNRKIGGTGSEECCAVVRQTSDRGYIISASTSSYGAGGSDGYLIKTDADGNTLWTSTFGGVNDDHFYSVEQTEEGGYIMTGSTALEGTSHLYLVKTNAAGRSLP